MKTLKITKADLDQNNTYIGSETVTDWSGHIEIEANLGSVRFPGRVSAKGMIQAKAGSGIEAGWGIEAKTLSAKLRIFAGLCSWRLPNPHEMEIRAKVLSGEVCYGTVIEPVRTIDEIKADIRSLSPEAAVLVEEMEKINE